jgi:glycosyltransferase involved in cell wall biosynthesis
MSKSICLVHYSSAPGGIEVLMPEIIRMFPDTRFSAFVIRPPEKGDINVYDHSQVRITYGAVNNIRAAFRLWRFGVKNRSSVFHGFNTGPFFLLIIRLAGVKKAVYSVRGTRHYEGAVQKVLRKAVWYMALAGSYRFIANSEYSRDVFTRYIPRVKPRISVVYNPVSSPRLKISSTRKTGGPFTVIYVGRLAEGKNLFRWLDIAILIHDLHQESQFLIYGDGPLRERLEDYGRKRNAGEYVFFKGYVPDIAGAYQQADLMMFISEYESFGNVVVESILCGTPVLAADIASLREIFRSYPQFLVPADERMESKILEKITALEELNKAVPQAADEFRRRFSLEQHITGLRKTYDSLNDQRT